MFLTPPDFRVHVCACITHASAFECLAYVIENLSVGKDCCTPYNIIMAFFRMPLFMPHRFNFTNSYYTTSRHFTLGFILEHDLFYYRTSYFSTKFVFLIAHTLYTILGYPYHTKNTHVATSYKQMSYNVYLHVIISCFSYLRCVHLL